MANIINALSTSVAGCLHAHEIILLVPKYGAPVKLHAWTRVWCCVLICCKLSGVDQDKFTIVALNKGDLHF